MTVPILCFVGIALLSGCCWFIAKCGNDEVRKEMEKDEHQRFPGGW